jgi:hypothetical protein
MLEFRREGLYRVSLSVDADPLWESLLKIQVALPQL